MLLMILQVDLDGPAEDDGEWHPFRMPVASRRAQSCLRVLLHAYFRLEICMNAANTSGCVGPHNWSVNSFGYRWSCNRPNAHC